MSTPTAEAVCPATRGVENSGTTQSPSMGRRQQRMAHASVIPAGGASIGSTTRLDEFLPVREGPPIRAPTDPIVGFEHQHA